LKERILGPNSDVEIQEDRSVVENYLALNKLTRVPRRAVPLIASKKPFANFSERELARFFFARRGALWARIQELVEGPCTSIVDVHECIAEKEPGFQVKRFLADIDPENLTVRKKGKLGHRVSIKLPTLETYTTKWYYPKGSIRTNGYTLQVLCFKLRELLSVKYKRLPDDRLPSRSTSIINGTDDFLTEIRNVFGTKEDVANLWPGIDPENTNTLTLDAGQAFVVGGYAYLLRKSMGKDESPPFKGSLPLASYSTTTLQDLMQTPSLEPLTTSRPPATTTAFDKAPYHSLADNQKAMMQPVFRYRRWLDDEKQLKPEGPERQHQSKPDIELLLIAEIETQLLPPRGPQASVVDYVNKLEEVEKRLMDFYNGNNNKFQKHTWDMKRAKHIEYQAFANSPLRIVGGCIGERRKDDNPVLIGVGLG
ncbi:hypothetical protein BGZ79_004256, partial [Entomortierella chlamydospora]